MISRRAALSIAEDRRSLMKRGLRLSIGQKPKSNKLTSHRSKRSQSGCGLTSALQTGDLS